jgi:ribosome-binding factor A
MSRRTERIGSLIRRIVAHSIQAELSDPRIERFTSVTRVEVSADLASAVVYVSIMADKSSAAELTLRALQSAAGRLRSRLADELTIRRVPALVFRQDESVRGAAETIRVIDALKDDHGGFRSGDDSGVQTSLEQEDS